MSCAQGAARRLRALLAGLTLLAWTLGSGCVLLAPLEGAPCDDARPCLDGYVCVAGRCGVGTAERDGGAAPPDDPLRDAGPSDAGSSTPDVDGGAPSGGDAGVVTDAGLELTDGGPADASAPVDSGDGDGGDETEPFPDGGDLDAGEPLADGGSDAGVVEGEQDAGAPVCGDVVLGAQLGALSSLKSEFSQPLSAEYLVDDAGGVVEATGGVLRLQADTAPVSVRSRAYYWFVDDAVTLLVASPGVNRFTVSVVGLEGLIASLYAENDEVVATGRDGVPLATTSYGLFTRVWRIRRHGDTVSLEVGDGFDFTCLATTSTTEVYARIELSAGPGGLFATEALVDDLNTSMSHSTELSDTWYFEPSQWSSPLAAVETSGGAVIPQATSWTFHCPSPSSADCSAELSSRQAFDATNGGVEVHLSNQQGATTLAEVFLRMWGSGKNVVVIAASDGQNAFLITDDDGVRNTVATRPTTARYLRLRIVGEDAVMSASEDNVAWTDVGTTSVAAADPAFTMLGARLTLTGAPTLGIDASFTIDLFRGL